MTIALIMVSVALGALVLAVVGYCCYASGWNASVQYHQNRDPMDPCWKTYV